MLALRRARVRIALAFAVFVFLGVSLLLARAFSGTGSERARVLDLVRAEARGDARAVLAATPACAREPACAAATRAWLPRVRRAGAVQILQYRPSADLTLTRRVGSGRVAWRVDGGAPVVQCVRVRREGPLTGGDAELLSISRPLGGEAACP